MSRALESVRILDFSMFQAGPHATRLMGDMGAEVVKIEAPHHPDPVRLNPRDIYPDNDPGERPWNRSGMINERNRSKMGVTLDLAAEEGSPRSGPPTEFSTARLPVSGPTIEGLNDTTIGKELVGTRKRGKVLSGPS